MTLATLSNHTGACDETGLVRLIPHMRAFARSLCRNFTEAEDLTQEALAKAWTHRDRYVAGTNLKAWVFTILRNQFYSDVRRGWRLTQLDGDFAEDTLAAVSSPNSPLELDDVRRAMARLPDDQREALILIGVAGLAYDEAAAICGCAQGTIKSRVSRARARLADLLSGSGLAAGGRTLGAMDALWADAGRLCAVAA